MLSAASDSFNLLFRALQDANRAQILSRPQIMTVDNKAGFVQVGQRVSRITGVINNGLTTQVVPTDVDVGLILEVLPRVGADGLISMQIRAERSAINQNVSTPIPTANGAREHPCDRHHQRRNHHHRLQRPDRGVRWPDPEATQ